MSHTHGSIVRSGYWFTLGEVATHGTKDSKTNTNGAYADQRLVSHHLINQHFEGLYPNYGNNRRLLIVVPTKMICSTLAASEFCTIRLEDPQNDDIVLQPHTSGPVTDPPTTLELESGTSDRHI